MAAIKAILLLFALSFFQGHQALNTTRLFNWLQGSLGLIDFLEENYPVELHDGIKVALKKRIERCDEVELEKWLKPYSESRLAMCFAEKGRYSGTDSLASRIEETRAVDVQDCQVKCQSHVECNFFLYFDKNHYQRFKHLTCRLLRSKGQLKLDQLGHVSGPKFCTDFDVQQLGVALKSDQLTGKLVQFYCAKSPEDQCMIWDQLEDEVRNVIGEEDLKKMDDLQCQRTPKGDQFMERKIPHESTGNSSSNDESPEKEASPPSTITVEEFSRHETDHLNIAFSTAQWGFLEQELSIIYFYFWQ